MAKQAEFEALKRRVDELEVEVDLLRARRIIYSCADCRQTGVSGRRPEPPALRVFGLPPGWRLISAPAGREDFVVCDKCAATRDAVAADMAEHGR